ncbi:hypothetical protein R1sor_017699 [Riccia sorocarpa]|uniref:Uncharacterized protein n=1 Tax=Riccia sorocarpa TaxID=122646 RepID=A0ABD3I7P3_9MARC
MRSCQDWVDLVLFKQDRKVRGKFGVESDNIIQRPFKAAFQQYYCRCGDAVKVEPNEEEPDDEEWYAEECIDGIMCPRLGIASENPLLDTTPKTE